MKTLAIVLSSFLKEDGSLSIEREKSVCLFVQQLSLHYDITLIVHGNREKSCLVLEDIGVKVQYDVCGPSNGDAENQERRTASRVQIQYEKWSKSKKIAGEFDCIIAWDGLSPYCLATTLHRVQAKRHILFLNKKLSAVLSPQDNLFYKEICEQFDVICTASLQLKENLIQYIGMTSAKLPIEVVETPRDTQNIIRKSEEIAEELLYNREKINLLIFSRMSIETELETVPELLAELNEDIHCTLIGNGPRLPRYWQQIAIWDVNTKITLINECENVVPYIRHCDVLVLAECEEQSHIREQAYIFNIPRLTIKECKEDIKNFKKIEKRLIKEDSWIEKEQMICLIEGE